MAEKFVVDSGDAVIADQDETRRDPTAALADLNAQLTAEKAKSKAATETAESAHRAAQEARQAAQAREQDITRYKSEAQSAQAEVITTAIDAATRELELAETEAASLMEAGDFRGATKAQSKGAAAAAKLVALEQAKVSLEAAPSAAQQPRSDDQRQSDSVEQFLSGFSPRAQAWLRQHREAIVRGNDGRPMIAPRTWGAHLYAIDDGLTPDSDEYFSYLDQHAVRRAVPAAHAAPAADAASELDLDDPDYVPPALAVEPAAAPAPRRTAPVAAPVSRDPPSNGGQPARATRTRLTPEQVEAARISGVTTETYAASLAELKAEGKIGRTTH